MDLIACNPPYQEAGTGLVNPDDSKRIARHEGACTPDDICRVASKLFKIWWQVMYVPKAAKTIRHYGIYEKVGSIMPKRLRLVQQRLSKGAQLIFIGRGERRKFWYDSGTCFDDRGDENGAFLLDEMLQIYGDYKPRKKGAVWQEELIVVGTPNRKFVEDFLQER